MECGNRSGKDSVSGKDKVSGRVFGRVHAGIKGVDDGIDYRKSTV
jgi:hypothetical protein